MDRGPPTSDGRYWGSPVPPPAVDLQLSSNPTLIFAADLLRRDAQVWLLLGGADVSATLRSIGGRARDLIAQGGVCLDARAERGGGTALYGRYDRGAVIPTQADSTGVHRWHQIDLMVYCLDSATTERLFGDERLSMRPVRASVLGRLAVRDAYAGTWARPLMSDDDYQRAADPRRRMRFLEKVETAIPDLPCFLLPFQHEDDTGIVPIGPGR